MPADKVEKAARTNSVATTKPMVLGVLTGLKREAEIALKLSPHVACAAAEPQKARWLVRKLIAETGVTHLLSFGIAAGLEPGLSAGTLVIGSQIKSRDGSWDTDAAWVRELTERLPTAQVGALWGSERIVGAPAAKQHLYESTQCLALDMESHVVAQLAHQARLPFMAVRVICDTAEQTVPPAALLSLCADGTPDMAAIFGNLMRHPRQIGDLIKLGKASGTAFRELAHAASTIAL
jgi:adenosylhomocysteine nucleosidase